MNNSFFSLLGTSTFFFSGKKTCHTCLSPPSKRKRKKKMGYNHLAPKFQRVSSREKITFIISQAITSLTVCVISFQLIHQMSVWYLTNQVDRCTKKKKSSKKKKGKKSRGTQQQKKNIGGTQQRKKKKKHNREKFF